MAGGFKWRTLARSISMLACAAGAAVSLTATGARAENYHYTYKRSAMPLLLDSSRVAVFRNSDGAIDAQGRGVARPDLGESIAELGIVAGELEPMAVRGWTTVRSPAVAGRGAGEEAVLDSVFLMANAAVGDFVSPVFLDEIGPVVVTQDLLIGFEADISQQEADRMIADLDLGEIVERSVQGMPGVYRVRSKSRNGFDVLRQSNEASFRAEVRFVEPDFIRSNEKHLIPNDPLWTSLWGLNNTGQSGGVANMDMDANLAWDTTAGDPSIVVVVIDDGCDLTHPDLNLAPGVDFTGTGPGGSHDPANPCDSHGTFVAGCISGKFNNSLQGCGVAPNCRVAPAKFSVSNQPCSGSGTFQTSWMTGCINFAQSSGAKVTNNSNGFGASGAIDTAYDNTRAAGVVHFASTGNGGNNTIGYPSSIPSVNAVGAITRTGARASFSQFGTGIDFVAPGQTIVTTARGGGTATVDGTSFSSPYAAGVAALLFSRNNLLSPNDVETTLSATVKDLGAGGYDTTFGWGLVNAKSGLDATPTPTPPGTFSLLTPANGATNVSRKPTVTWGVAQFAQSYTLKIDNDPAFGSPEVDVTTGFNSYSYTGSPFPAATQIFWKVTANNDLGSTPSTPVSASFTTISDPPGAFSLNLPADNAMGAALTPNFTWTSSPLAEEYRIRIDDNADFSSPIVDFTTTLATFVPGAPLAPNTQHYWTVTAINPIGSVVSTPSSRTFTTMGAAPTGFNLISPPDGPNISTFTPTLVWSMSGGASSYTVQVDEDPGFGSPEIDQTGIPGTSYMLPFGPLTNQTRYYWRVYGVNGAGSTLSTPSAFSFGLAVPPCAGDANEDQMVNFDDINSVIAFWLTNYGPGNTGPGDANHDGVVNFVDISNVISNWGSNCP